MKNKPGPQTGPRTKGQPPLDNLIAQLGITIWRLRPARGNDAGARQLIRENGKKWIPERIEADTPLREGDRVRLSIESPAIGYLYIVDRDLFSNGNTGDPMLQFPFATDDNHVYAGRLVDIPAQDAEPNYFTAKPARADQIGELLTIIVTKSPLDLPLSKNAIQITNAQMRSWEKMWGGESERFEMEGGAGEAWTQAEKQAAAKKGTRQLSRDDPAPQTIYRVSTTDNKGFLLNVRLRYTK